MPVGRLAGDRHRNDQLVGRIYADLHVVTGRQAVVGGAHELRVRIGGRGLAGLVLVLAFVFLQAFERGQRVGHSLLALARCPLTRGLRRSGCSACAFSVATCSRASRRCSSSFSFLLKLLLSASARTLVPSCVRRCKVTKPWLCSTPSTWANRSSSAAPWSTRKSARVW